MVRLSLPRLVLMIALIAVLARSLVPMGYMPGTGSGKVFHMVICTINGPQTIALDDKMQPLGDQPTPSHDVKEKCAFGLVNHSPAVIGLITAFLVTPYQKAEQQRLVVHDQLVRHSLFYTLAQPRAPPVIA